LGQACCARTAWRFIFLPGLCCLSQWRNAALVGLFDRWCVRINAGGQSLKVSILRTEVSQHQLFPVE
jgi:hypothetical protein